MQVSKKRKVEIRREVGNQIILFDGIGEAVETINAAIDLLENSASICAQQSLAIRNIKFANSYVRGYTGADHVRR